MEDDIYDMADDEIVVDTESVVSPKDLIKRLNSEADMSAGGRKYGAAPGGKPPKPLVKPKDFGGGGFNLNELKKTQGALKPVGLKPVEKLPSPLRETSGNGVENELQKRLMARRKASENGDPGIEKPTKEEDKPTKVDKVNEEQTVVSKQQIELKENTIASGLALALQNLEAKKSQSGPTWPANMVHVAPQKPFDPNKRKPAPLPKNNKKTNEKLDSDFEIITHKGVKYKAYRLPLIDGKKSRKPFRTHDIVLPEKYSEMSKNSNAGRNSFIIEPTASSDEEEEQSSAGSIPIPPRPGLPPQSSAGSIPIPPRPGLPPLTVKKTLPSQSGDCDDFNDDGESFLPAPSDDQDEKLYEPLENEQDGEEEQRLKEKKEEERKAAEEKQRQKEERRKAREQKERERKMSKEKKNKEKEEKEIKKMKKLYKLDGSERVLFSGKAKDKISRNLGFDTLYEKGEDVPVIRTDENINPKGKWLVQLKDGKYEYVDTKLIEEPKKEGPSSALDYEEENIYEGEEDYDEGFSGSAIIEEDVYEDINVG